MPPYAVTYEADYAEQRSRPHTFFRWLTVIPVGFVLAVFSLGLIITLPVAWIAMVITGRYIPALYAYHSGLLRMGTRVTGYGLLVTDAYPSFGLAENPEYPVRVATAPAKHEYSRLKALFRLILAIPVSIVSYVLVMVADLVALVAWFVILVLGKQVPALQGATNMGLAYHTRAMAYLMLLTEDWPPFADIDMAIEPRAPDPELPAAPMTFAAPAGLDVRDHN